MAAFNPSSRANKALIATTLLGVALEQETDPVKRERIQKVLGVIPKPPVKVATKCMLPSCSAMTTHNGGYCCAEHCVARRLELKLNLVKAGAPHV